MNSTPDPAHLQVNYTQSMDHITNYTPQASSLHVNYLMTYVVDHITSAPKSGSPFNTSEYGSCVGSLSVLEYGLNYLSKKKRIPKPVRSEIVNTC